MDLVDPYYMIIDRLMKEVYGEEGADWFNWFCFENDFGTKGLEAWDAMKIQFVIVGNHYGNA
jgi:hypothetical protein